MEFNTRTAQAQQNFFGKRFVGATLAKTNFSDGSTSEAIAKWVNDMKNFLVVLGPPGTGKTYLCAALLEYVIDKVNFMRCYHERDLLRRIRDGFNEASKGDYIRHLHQLIDDDLVILDDIGSSGHTDWREEVLFETIDYRYQKMLPLIITTNLTEKEIYGTYGARLGSRLFATENTIIDLHGLPDMRREGC